MTTYRQLLDELLAMRSEDLDRKVVGFDENEGQFHTLVLVPSVNLARSDLARKFLLQGPRMVFVFEDWIG